MLNKEYKQPPFYKIIKFSGTYWARTSDPYSVKVML